MTVGNFPQFFKRFGAAGKLRPYHNLNLAFGHIFGDAGDNLCGLVDGKAAFGFVLCAVGGFEEYALCRIFFVHLDFLAFDDDVVPDGECAVF